MTSLGFDTIVIHNHWYDNDSLSELLNTFSYYGIKNFIFLSDFDFSLNSLSVENEKLNNFKARFSKASLPRGVFCKAFYNLSIDKGSAFNKDIKRVYSVRKYRSLFVNLPLFTETNHELIAQDINHLIYRQKAFPVFSHFDGIINTTSKEFYSKLIKNTSVGFAMDINYIFDPNNASVILDMIKSKALIVPMIAHHNSNYVGVLNEAEFFMEKIGKKNYYQLCTQMRKCATKFDC